MRRVLLLATSLVLFIAACSSNSDGDETVEAGSNDTSQSVETTAAAPTTEASEGSPQGTLTDAASAPVTASDDAGKPTVTITEPGEPADLILSDTTVGTGLAAAQGDLAEIHYVGLLTDGTEFDNSWDRDATFMVPVGTGAVIPGFDQGLVGMAEGGRRVLVIPPSLGYGASGAGAAIPADATLIFVIDMVKVFDLERPEPPTDVAAPDGLEITDITVGSGPMVESGQTVTVHYMGSLLDGTIFDTSWDRGQPFTTPIGQGRVIQGWDEGIVGMQAGGRRILVIPSDLAYGETGSGPVIQPNTPLVFIVDLLQVR
jgi:FKBP-type peptidyl-prolyl cis-trans isomerase